MHARSVDPAGDRRGPSARFGTGETGWVTASLPCGQLRSEDLGSPADVDLMRLALEQ
jgi:hypothetical protein